MNAKHLNPRHATITVVACILAVSAAFARPASMNVRLANDVVPAPDGYEAVSAKYIAAKPTDIYISPFIWAGKVIGAHLNAGQPVDVLAKPKGYNWLLIGKNGEGIGYVPISVLSVAK
jgi:hypothetical protein